MQSHLSWTCCWQWPSETNRCQNWDAFELSNTNWQTAANEIFGNGRILPSFCQNFSLIVAPLTNLLKKRQEYQWTEDCQAEFQSIKMMLSSKPVLRAPVFQKPFHFMVDASDIGAGAVLMQCDDKGIEHPVCYFSRNFDQHQNNYSTIEKEALALLLALQHFDVYLSTTVFPITDHNPLIFVNKMKNSNQRLLRWSLLFQEYNFKINHIHGKDNVIADALSRI